MYTELLQVNISDFKNRQSRHFTEEGTNGK